MAIKIESECLLTEERNRIAEELHDCVSQYLFGIVTSAHSMKRDWNSMTEEQKLEHIQEIQEAAAEASRELRMTIYNLGSSKFSTSSWIASIESYLAKQAKLNGVGIRFYAPNPCLQLSVVQQKALYRIISEGVGNAIRHGASKNVNIRLTQMQGIVKLTIVDNGNGFNLTSQKKQIKVNSGLGLSNMRKLAASLGGTFDVYSREGGGTRVRVLLPLEDITDRTNHNTKSG
ncbi:sensor histidine kinase [Paenibacillus alkalitolerans]|uniref:sensor histidine kinase n=1 Tax=Paenibacillus alkalitolerans TaxID=2799335 RepID=UPI0018F33B2E|nr:sensor histidine kinase [Paenibacillus alkalitolerans]